MNELCEECNGACCECLAIPVQGPHDRAWIEGRAIGESDGMAIVLCRCRHLTSAGLCAIQIRKPAYCTWLIPGKTDCLRVLKALRPEMAAKIALASKSALA